MARGKYFSLEEACKLGHLDRFCKERPFEGDEEFFNQPLDAMAKAGQFPASDATRLGQWEHHEFL